MRTIFHRLFAAVFLIAAAAVIGPYVETAVYAMRLATMPVPDIFSMPAATVRARDLRSTWNAPRAGGQRRHEGIDIFAARGSRVVASTEGIVQRVGQNNLGGNVVWVLGPGGQRHYYAHLDRFADAHAGMRVEAGTLLGYVGNTGNAAGTPPHLHYGIYAVGGAVDPFPFLRHAE